MQTKIIEFPGAGACAEGAAQGQGCAPQAAPQENTQGCGYARQAASQESTEGREYVRQPAAQGSAEDREYARQTVPQERADGWRDTQTDISQYAVREYDAQEYYAQEYNVQAQPRAQRSKTKSSAPRHARRTCIFSQHTAPRAAVHTAQPAPRAAVHTAQPAPRSLRAVRAAARRRKRRRQRLLLLAGVVPAVALILTLRALFPTAPASQPPEDDSPEPYVPAVAIPQEGPPYVIAIDAGHGGTDVGAQGVVDESVMTETTIGYLESWLLQDENYTPVRTHEYDTFLENADRAATANGARASLLLSVHGNSDPYSEKSYGFECYAQPPGRTYHDASIRFAHIICGKIGTAGQRLRGNAGVRYIYYVGDDAHGYQKEVIEESDSTVRAEQTFGLLEKTDCPAVLAEQCFVTSPSDVNSWGDDDGCRLAARLYYEAICDYFGTEPLAQ